MTDLEKFHACYRKQMLLTNLKESDADGVVARVRHELGEHTYPVADFYDGVYLCQCGYMANPPVCTKCGVPTDASPAPEPSPASPAEGERRVCPACGSLNLKIDCDLVEQLQHPDRGLGRTEMFYWWECEVCEHQFRFQNETLNPHACGLMAAPSPASPEAAADVSHEGGEVDWPTEPSSETVKWECFYKAVWQPCEAVRSSNGQTFFIRIGGNPYTINHCARPTRFIRTRIPQPDAEVERSVAERADKETQALKAQLDAANARIGDLQKQLDDVDPLGPNIASLKGTIKDLRSQVEMYQRWNDSAEVEGRLQRQTIKQRESELNGIRQQLTAATSRLAECEAKAAAWDKTREFIDGYANSFFKLAEKDKGKEKHRDHMLVAGAVSCILPFMDSLLTPPAASQETDGEKPRAFVDMSGKGSA